MASANPAGRRDGRRGMCALPGFSLIIMAATAGMPLAMVQAQAAMAAGLPPDLIEVIDARNAGHRNTAHVGTCPCCRPTGTVVTGLRQGFLNAIRGLSTAQAIVLAVLPDTTAHWQQMIRQDALLAARCAVNAPLLPR